MNQFDRECFRDHGVFADAGGAHVDERKCAPSSSKKFESPGLYVAACRRLARSRGIEIAADGRLIGAGWCQVSPTNWIVGGQLKRFVDYYSRAVERPKTVGSSYNPDPETVYRAMRCGIPASVVLRLGHAENCIPSKIVALPRRYILRLVRAGRAMSRKSWRSRRLYASLFSLKTIEFLGRLSPEGQEVALKDLDIRDRKIRIRDLPLQKISDAERLFASDPRQRMLAAVGKRQEALITELCPAGMDPAEFVCGIPGATDLDRAKQIALEGLHTSRTEWDADYVREVTWRGAHHTYGVLARSPYEYEVDKRRQICEEFGLVGAYDASVVQYLSEEIESGRLVSSSALDVSRLGADRLDLLRLVGRLDLATAKDPWPTALSGLSTSSKRALSEVLLGAAFKGEPTGEITTLARAVIGESTAIFNQTAAWLAAQVLSGKPGILDADWKHIQFDDINLCLSADSLVDLLKAPIPQVTAPEAAELVSSYPDRVVVRKSLYIFGKTVSRHDRKTNWPTTGRVTCGDFRSHKSQGNGFHGFSQEQRWSDYLIGADRERGARWVWQVVVTDEEPIGVLDGYGRATKCKFRSGTIVYSGPKEGAMQLTGRSDLT